MSEDTTTSGAAPRASGPDPQPPFRYDAALASEIEPRWQDRWEAAGTFDAPNPSGPLAGGFERTAGRPKFYVLDMFPYPSGAGLHVGHPLGYIATDVLARYLRMTGHHGAAPVRLRRVRAAGGAVRDRHRPASRGHHQAQHRQHAPPAAAAGPRA